MRILVDLQGCQSGSRFGGIGRYSMSLAKAMLRLESGHEICLLLNNRLPNENAIRAEFADLMPQQHILTFAVPAYVAAEYDLPAHTRLAELMRENASPKSIPMYCTSPVCLKARERMSSAPWECCFLLSARR